MATLFVWVVIVFVNFVFQTVSIFRFLFVVAAFGLIIPDTKTILLFSGASQLFTVSQNCFSSCIDQLVDVFVAPTPR